MLARKATASDFGTHLVFICFMVPRSRAKSTMSIIIKTSTAMRTIISVFRGRSSKTIGMIPPASNPQLSKTIKPKLRSIMLLTRRWHQLMLLRINGIIKAAARALMLGAAAKLTMQALMKMIYREQKVSIWCGLEHF